MNKYNKLGMELLEYKTELSKDYSELILKSLQSSVDLLANNGIIDLDIHYALKGADTDYEALKDLLLTKHSCIKTYNELLAEYEVIRENFNKKLDLEYNEDIQTQSVVENEKILLVQDFIMTEDFIKEYFFIESEKDFETLMGRKGFLHKFAILRLEKILKEFIKSENYDELELSHSAVFYHEKKNVYGIQLVFSFNVEDLEQEKSLESLAFKTKNMIEKANEYYHRKMVA